MAASATDAPSALDPNEWKSFKVTEKEQLTHNTIRLKFGLPDANQVVGLPVASCMVTRAPLGDKKEDGSTEQVIRPYTPVSAPDARGFFELVVKVYPDGKMSKHMEGLKVGDALECKGPIIKLEYKPNMKHKIGMVAGGTGITPMLQIADEILRNSADKTDVSLIYANQTPSDIIVRDKIDAMEKEHSNFHVHYTVDEVPTVSGLFWKYSTGYVTQEMIEKHLVTPGDDNLVIVCGPPPFMKAISGDKNPDKSQGEVSGVLEKMGFTKSMVHKM